MKLTKIALVLPIAFLFAIGDGQAKDQKKNKSNHGNAKTTEKEWKRSTEGHRPQDLNGDGVITRNEWPGNDASFRELDSDGDGVLTNKDRGYAAQGADTRMYKRPVNDYSKGKKK